MGWPGMWGCTKEPDRKRKVPLAKQRVLPLGATRMERLCGDHTASPNPAPQLTDANQKVTEHCLPFHDNELINPKV